MNEKKVYEAPVLVVLGSVAEITLGNSGKGNSATSDGICFTS